MQPQYTIQNLGLTVPGQQKAQGYFTSVGTGLGFGKRHEPVDGQNVRHEYLIHDDPDGRPARILDYPGAGEYDIGKTASQNSNPTWK